MLDAAEMPEVQCGGCRAAGYISHVILSLAHFQCRTRHTSFYARAIHHAYTFSGPSPFRMLPEFRVVLLRKAPHRADTTSIYSSLHLHYTVSWKVYYLKNAQYRRVLRKLEDGPKARSWFQETPKKLDKNLWKCYQINNFNLKTLHYNSQS